MSEPTSDPSHPLPLLEAAAKKLPFQEMKDQILLFGAFCLLALLVIIAGQEWPVNLQFIIILVIFITPVAAYVYLRTRESPRAPRSVSAPPLLVPHSIPLTDAGRHHALAVVEEAEKFRQPRIESYRELAKRHIVLGETADLLADAAGARYVQPSQYESWQVVDSEAARLLLRLLEAVSFYQDDRGYWDDLIKWNVWGYMIQHADKDWRGAARCAKRIAWVWYRRERVADMRVWVDKLAVLLDVATKSGKDSALQAGLELAHGRLELLDGHLVQSAEYFNRALVLYQGLDDSHGIWQAHADLGLLEIRRRNHQDAKHHLDEATHIADLQKWPVQQIDCRYAFWRLYDDWAFDEEIHRSNADNAFSALLELQNGGKIQTERLNARIYFELAQTQQKQGDLQGAYLAARRALKAEKLLQTALWPEVQQLVIDIGDTLIRGLLLKNDPETV